MDDAYFPLYIRLVRVTISTNFVVGTTEQEETLL